MDSSNAQAATDCKPCPPGSYCDQLGLSYKAGDCTQGYFCTSGAITPTPLVVDPVSNLFGPCPAGFYCPAASPYPVPCLAGTFSAALVATSSSTCTPCTPGHYCGADALTAVEGLCDPGYYCPSGSQSPRPYQSECLPGQYCPTGSSSVTSCPSGTY